MDLKMFESFPLFSPHFTQGMEYLRAMEDTKFNQINDVELQDFLFH